MEFRNPKLERQVALTAADRKWMDAIVTDVNEGWSDEDPTKVKGMQYVYIGGHLSDVSDHFQLQV